MDPTDLLQVNHLRRDPTGRHSATPAKEWLHFCILGPDVDLLVNVSFCDSGCPGIGEQVRLTVLARGDEGEWDGDVETFEHGDVLARAGTLDVRLGRNRVRFRDGRFEVDIALRDRPVAATLVLDPLAWPVRAPNVPLLDGPPLHWVIVPRLAAHGRTCIGGREYALDGHPAYHDHNWGRFRWGQDFAWRWGFALPEGLGTPWSLAFAFLSDRPRARALSHGMFLWRGLRPARTFRDDAVEVRTSPDFLRPARIVKIPRVMALVAPELSTDIPRTAELRARDGADWAHLHFEAREVVQVVVPNDADLGATIINEVTGTSYVEGEIGGRAFGGSSRSVFEFLGS